MISGDLLYQVIKGTFKDHLVTWLMTYLVRERGQKQEDKMIDKIDWRYTLFSYLQFQSLTYTSMTRIAITPAFSGLRNFPQGCNFTQWTEDNFKGLIKVHLWFSFQSALSNNFHRSTFLPLHILFPSTWSEHSVHFSISVISHVATFTQKTLSLRCMGTSTIFITTMSYSLLLVFMKISIHVVGTRYSTISNLYKIMEPWMDYVY